MQVTGNVGVVTGAGSGLGAALARRLAAAGMRVAVADIAADNAEKIAARNVLDDLAANRPYTITHYVHAEAVEARPSELREAFELARR